MLLMRSSLSKICLLVALQIVRGQNYESEYSTEEGDDQADNTGDGSQTDYSKYYSVDGSAPLIKPQGEAGISGFVNPADFYSFFSSPEFGASNRKQAQIAPPKNPFAAQSQLNGFIDPKKDFLIFQSSSPRDYFEEAQKKQQLKKEREEDDDEDESSYESKPGPSYASHKLPAKYASTNHEPVKAKPTTTPSKEYEPISDKTEEVLDTKQFQVPDYTFDYPTGGKLQNYNVGKSSSTVSQLAGLDALASKQVTKPLLPTLTPYQKYSFQPVPETTNFQPSYLEAILSTSAPFNPSYKKFAPKAIESQASENVPSNLNNCAKITKEVPQTDIASGKIVAQKMDCYVCEDPKTAVKHTQCSYQSEPESEKFFTGESERYSIPARPPSGFRYKRYSGDETNPYEYVRSRSLAAFGKNKPDQTHEAFSYEPEHYSPTFERSTSETQAEEIAKKNPDNCEKVSKDSMTCTVCKDPKTGGKYEQCSYTSAPSEKSYAYVTEKKYDSDDDKPEATKIITKTLGKEDPAEAQKKISELLGEQTQQYPQKSKKNKKSQPIKDFTKRASSFPEPVEDYKGKIYQHKRPERAYSTEENSGEEDKEEANKESYADISKPGEKTEVSDDDLFEKIEDPYGYNVHKEFAESQKRSNYVDSDGDGDKKEAEEEDPYAFPKNFGESKAEETKEEEKAEEREDTAESKDAEAETTEDRIANFEKEIEAYHRKLFPDYDKQESRQTETEDKTYPDYYKEGQQAETKEVEEVLAEFVKKDRSNCKQAKKNGMTCYLCVDKQGMQHEECMYVSESKPRPTQVAYHDIEEVKIPNQNAEGTVSKLVTAPTSPSLGPTVSSTVLKPVAVKTGAKNDQLELVAAASEAFETRVKYEPSESKKISKREEEKEEEREESDKAEAEDEEEPSGAFTNDDSDRLPDDDPEKLTDVPTQETPAEFQVGETEGAYSEETKPVYSEALGVTLPRYMLEKSAFEKEFDEFAGTA